MGAPLRTSAGSSWDRKRDVLDDLPFVMQKMAADTWTPATRLYGMRLDLCITICCRIELSMFVLDGA